jgi:hypothetical protein
MRDRSLQEPADILRGLNRRLIGRSEGGFTTCLLLHVTDGGELTLANAEPRRLFLNPARDLRRTPTGLRPQSGNCGFARPVVPGCYVLSG